MNPLDLIEKLINEHASAAVLRDHLALFRDRLQYLEQEHVRVQAENAELKKQIAQATKKLEEKSAADEFVKHRGVLFHKLPGGKIEDEVYCPKCKTPMFSLGGIVPYSCSGCGFTASFNELSLKRIVGEIGG